MATLKDHQQAMVDLLASGSGIPASASRLAHAMHDVVDVLIAAFPNVPLSPDVPQGPKRIDATTPGLNDKALAADVEACRPKDTMFDRARAAERRVKELENTVNQLKDRVAKLKADQAYWYGRCLEAGILDESQEQAGCRKHENTGRKHENTGRKLVDESARIGVAYAELGMKYAELVKILAFYGVDDLEKARTEYTKYNVETEQAGCRKDDTQVCEHEWVENFELGRPTWIMCEKCGAHK